MQNGDRYFGKVLSMSADTVMLDSDMLGKIKVPRKMVSGLVFGASSAAPAVATRVPHAAGPTNLVIDMSAAHRIDRTVTPAANTNASLASAFQQLGSNTNFVGQIRDQMLGSSPAATAKYDEMLTSMMNGSMSLDDLRQQAKTAADQLRALKQQEGADADSSLDGYLQQLDSFIKETDNAPNPSAPIVPPKGAGP